MATMSDQQSRTLKDQFMLRLPDGMRDRIRQVAADNNRSMNAEIVATLEAAYPPPRSISDLDEVIEQVARDGMPRIAVRESHDLHVSLGEDGRIVLQVEPRQPIRDI